LLRVVSVRMQWPGQLHIVLLEWFCLVLGLNKGPTHTKATSTIGADPAKMLLPAASSGQ